MDGRELQRQPTSIGSGDASSFKGTLCNKCLAIPWKPDNPRRRQSIQGTYEWTLDHHEKFKNLEASCETGCPLCQNFFLLLTYDGLGSEESDPLRWDLVFNGYELYLKFGTQRLDCMNEWYTYDSGRRIPSQAVTTVKGLAPSDLINDLHALLEESIKPWLEACLCPEVHPNCPDLPPNEQASYHMPTRLIDVGSGRQPIAKIIVSADLSEDEKRSPYLILSYQWGKGNDPARTTTKNLEKRKHDISFQHMPKTIRDAIDITRLMGVRYLWVDAVCIIQADRILGSQQDDVVKADWEKESMNMTDYYSNALCCIAAASAKDSSEGFLTERQVARYSYKEWHSPANVFFTSPHAIRRRFRSSLLSRGWCLQEWLLSPRILHWTSNGLIWQCSHGFFWEGQSGFQGEHPEEFPQYRYDPGGRQTNDCILDLGFNIYEAEDICQILRCGQMYTVGYTWTSLVSEFSHMNLSFPTDRLAAVQGIATKLSERHGLEYFAGVFRSHCVEHLLWRAEYPPTSAEGIDTFPTWSWASSQSEIYFLPAEAWFSLVSDIQLFPSAKEQANLSNMTNKELRFTAPLVKLSDLKLEDSDSPDQREDTESESEGSSTEIEKSAGTRAESSFRVEGPVWEGLTCKVVLDNLATPLPFTDRAYLLALRQSPDGLQGLLVQKVDDENRVDLRDNMNVYVRIGMFFITGPPPEFVSHPKELLSFNAKVILI